MGELMSSMLAVSFFVLFSNAFALAQNSKQVAAEAVAMEDLIEERKTFLDPFHVYSFGMFRQLDRNGDGVILLTDLPSNFTKHLQLSGEVSEIARQMDTSKDGKIQDEEFLAFCDPKLAVIWSVDDFRDADYNNDTKLNTTEFDDSKYLRANHSLVFADMDKDRSGGISVEEYAMLATDEFTMIDGNGDGKVTKEEWVKYAEFRQQDGYVAKPGLAQEFEQMDSNKDGSISRVEQHTYNYDKWDKHVDENELITGDTVASLPGEMDGGMGDANDDADDHPHGSQADEL